MPSDEKVWEEQQKRFAALEGVAPEDRRRKIEDCTTEEQRQWLRMVGELWEGMIPLVTRFMNKAMKVDREKGGLLQMEEDDLWADCMVIVGKTVHGENNYDWRKAKPGSYLWGHFLGARKKILVSAQARLDKGKGHGQETYDPVPDIPAQTGVQDEEDDGVELRNMEHARSVMPEEIGTEPMWSALCCVLGEARSADPVTRWRVWSRLPHIHEETSATGQETVYVPALDAVRPVARWSLWRTLADTDDRTVMEMDATPII